MRNIIIIGAGPSGIICAIEASKNKNNNVTIIEKNSKIGVKLLLSGNGKCNYTNTDFNLSELKKYYNTDIIKDVFVRFGNVELIRYFDNIGIPSRVFEKNSNKYIYPLTNSSKDVVRVLKNNLNRVNIVLNENIEKINLKNDKFILNSKNSEFYADELVLAVGGITHTMFNSNHYFENCFNYNIIKPIPSLVGLKTKDDLFSNIDSFRVFAEVSLIINDEVIKQEIGEIQIKNNTISGIPVFQLSKIAGRHILKDKVYIEINFLKYIIETNEHYFEYIKNRLCNFIGKTIYDFLIGILDIKLIDNMINKLHLSHKMIIDKNIINEDKFITQLTILLTKYRIQISDFDDLSEAQVTSGGIDINEVDLKSFMSKNNKNLYIIGEMLDVDGICGGYNLQFAFSSGYICGVYLNDSNKSN